MKSLLLFLLGIGAGVFGTSQMQPKPKPAAPEAVLAHGPNALPARLESAGGAVSPGRLCYLPEEQEIELEGPAARATEDSSAPMIRALELNSISLEKALTTLASQIGRRVVVSDLVLTRRESINIQLGDKTPLDAIRIICHVKNLVLVEDDDVLYVKEHSEKVIEPVETYYYTFEYGKAADALRIIRATIQSHIEPLVDPRTNTIFFTDFKSNIRTVIKTLRILDRELPKDLKD